MGRCKCVEQHTGTGTSTDSTPLVLKMCRGCQKQCCYDCWVLDQDIGALELCKTCDSTGCQRLNRKGKKCGKKCKNTLPKCGFPACGAFIPICDGCKTKPFQCSGKILLQCNECSKCQKFRCDLPWKRKCRKCGKRCCGIHTSGTLDSDKAVLEYASKNICVDCDQKTNDQVAAVCQGVNKDYFGNGRPCRATTNLRECTREGCGRNVCPKCIEYGVCVVCSDRDTYAPLDWEDDTGTNDGDDIGTNDTNVLPVKYKVGDAVELFSRSNQKWYSGTVTYNTAIVDEERLYDVTYNHPDFGQDEKVGCFPEERMRPLTGIRRRLANRRYRDSPVLLRLLEEIREANRRHQARQRALERARR